MKQSSKLNVSEIVKFLEISVPKEVCSVCEYNIVNYAGCIRGGRRCEIKMFYFSALVMGSVDEK